MRTLSLLAAAVLLLAAAAAWAAPAAEKTSPFDAIYIADDGTITVTVGEAKGTLVSVDGLDAARLVEGAKAEYGRRRWKKRIAEDLPDAMEAITGTRPESVVPVVVKPDGGEEVTVEAEFTADKRRRIWASDYGDGPRAPR